VSGGKAREDLDRRHGSQGADAVVMVEYCHLMDQTTVEVARAISPQENVIQAG